MKEDHMIQSASSDITFCTSRCNNKKCSRNVQGDLFKKAHGNGGWFSMSDYGDSCTSYKPRVR